MIALLKSPTPDKMTGGHRWTYIRELLEGSIELSADAGWLLCVLLAHH